MKYFYVKDLLFVLAFAAFMMLMGYTLGVRHANAILDQVPTLEATDAGEQRDEELDRPEDDPYPAEPDCQVKIHHIPHMRRE